MKRLIIISAILATAVSCGNNSKISDLAIADNFKGKVDGREVALYTLSAGDITMQVTNFGARVVSLYTPDKNGKMDDIVLGRASLEEYVHPEGERFLGACVGPVANRIGGASFSVDGVRYETPKNDNSVNTLHGGFLGVDNMVWDVVSVSDRSITLHLLHPDGLEGYPGNVDMTMIYALTDDNQFCITYKATTDKATPVNFTNHPFFNLGGPSVEDYLLMVNADSFVPIDSLSIPTGEILPVEGTPFDFRQEHRVGERIAENDQQLINARGYDHNWCLSRKGNDVETACIVYDPSSGREVEVLTDQKGIQIYSGNFFDGKYSDRHSRPMAYRGSIALEAQAYPDSPNHDNFTDITLLPGQTYTQNTVYKFSVRK